MKKDLYEQCQRLVIEFSSELDQLERYTYVLLALAQMRFEIDRLKAMRPCKRDEFTMSEAHEVTSLQTALSVNYGRLFAAGAVKLDPKDVPDNLKSYHRNLMEMRHKRFAHHGGHDSVVTDLDFEFDGETVTIFQRGTVHVPLGALEGVEDLLEWLAEHMQKRSAKVLKRMTEKSDVEWHLALPSNFQEPSE